MGLLNKIFGDYSEREIKRIKPIVEKIFFSFIISTILSTSNFLSSLDNSVSHIYFILNFVSKNKACAGLVVK